MKPVRDDLISKAVKLGTVIRQHRAKGKLQSIAPPTIFGYRAFLRLARALPKLTLKQAAMATMVGNASAEDRKLIRTILDDALGADDSDGEHAAETLLIRPNSINFSHLNRDRSPEFDSSWPDAVESYGVGPMCGEVEEKLGIFEKPVEPCEDPDAATDLRREAHPIFNRLNSSLYAARHACDHTQRRMITGSLDPLRLAAASFDRTIFRKSSVLDRIANIQRLSLIACDASGSVVPGHMKMFKVLSLAILGYALGNGLEIIIGLYNSGHVGKGRRGPVVRWVYHPEKVSIPKGTGIVRRVASLHNHGTGVQSDLLSLLFMMDEARRIARGRSIAMTVITDGQWNNSFTLGKGDQEVRWFFESARDQLNGKFHSTLIAVGASTEIGLEDVVDKFIAVPTSSLANVSRVAQQIACYIGQGFARILPGMAEYRLVQSHF